MGDLSPAAQSVLDAAQGAYWLWNSMCPAEANVIAAASLRAAAHHGMPPRLEEDAFHSGYWFAMACLASIAAELETSEASRSP